MSIALTLVFLLLGAAHSVATAAAAPASPDANSLTVIAEIALERGDCKTAAEAYAAAVPNGSVGLAKRASEVALACEHMPAAWESVQRWRALAPNDLNAVSVYAAIALKLYRIEDAQAAIGAIVVRQDSDARLAELAALLLDEAEAPAVLAAIGGAVNTETASPAILTLLGELALEARDLHRAEQYAQRALKSDSSLFTARALIAQIYAAQGDESNALLAARAVQDANAERGRFEVSEVLITLGKFDEARQELERLRAAGTSAEEIDRRLAILAFQTGNLSDARQRFARLDVHGEAGEAVQLYLADIAALQGDVETALSGYRKLVDSSLAAAARTRAAGLLLERGKRSEALTLLDDYVGVHPESSFEMTLTKVQLLSEHGETDSGLALLTAALERHPQHPALEYQRAVLLERDGQVRESVALLERLVAARPGDSTLLNALGYTLADHDMHLAHAEKLIRRALAVAPDNPAIVDSLGWVRFKRGDLHGAAAILGHAYALGGDAEIAAHWGEVLWKSGAKKEARTVWLAARERDSHSKALQAIISRYLPQEKP